MSARDSRRARGACSDRLGARAALRLLCPLLLFSLAACHVPSGRGVDAARVEAEVRDTLRAFEAAEKTLDPDAVLRFLAPDFRMLQDGQRVDAPATVAQIRSALPSLRSFTPRFEQVEVVVLARDAALTHMVFHDVITDAEGVTTRQWGPSTLLWRHIAGDWRIQFADSDHYPEEDAP